MLHSKQCQVVQAGCEEALYELVWSCGEIVCQVIDFDELADSVTAD